MMVRTYGRRNRGIPSNYSSDALNDAVHDPLSQENDTQLYGLPFSSSQEESSHWPAFEFDPYGLDSSQPQASASASFDDVVPRPRPPPAKKARVSAKRARGFSLPAAPPPSGSGPSIAATSTLMEAQEFGEMMEHVDEVNFALDGLRKDQPVRIRRASLLSLLAICGTHQQRRLLRTQGMAKTIIDAVLGLSFDDSPSNLAAAALLYVLTSDGQDDHLLESPSCIRFLIRLLKPIASASIEEKLPKIGSKLLALRTVADSLHNSNKRLDSSSAAIFSKVHEVLVSCKEIKSIQGNSGTERPELCPKWIALLTMERACLSTISLEESSGTVRKSGGNFKEKLRELGGLDAVFEVAMNCHSDMESWMEAWFPFSRDAKVDIDMQCLSLLLKCLKIMENATFLSKDNQDHLLGMKRRPESTAVPISFTQLIISVIKILSDLALLKASAAASMNKKSSTQSDENDRAIRLALISDTKGDVDENLFDDSSKSNLEKIYSENDFTIWKNDQFVAASQFEYPSSETTSTSMSENYSLKTRLRSSASSSCSGTSRSLSSSMRAIKDVPRKNDIVQKFDNTLDLLEANQDPFAFDEDDMEPSKWEILSGKKTVPRTKRNGLMDTEFDYGFQSQLIMSQEETSNGENDHSNEASCSTAVDEETSSLLADCLLTAVKALMNVTNDNPVGCRQIASFGGLETMSSLIACHFPSFSSSSSSFNATRRNSLFVDLDSPDDRPLSDHELDFLVAILGLLVNLVEKDSQNRSRLASASVQLHKSQAYDDMSSKDVIPLLCSIFLANQGAGEAVHDGKDLPGDEEDAVLQGEKEAEKMILEAYAALLLAFLSTESKNIREAITDCLPDSNLAVLVPVLERFVAFHLSLNMISPETHQTVSEVIESCRR